MILNFSIKNKEKNIIVITGLTQEGNEYLPEDSWIVRYYNYKYTDCVTINLIQRITTEGTITFKTYFNKHDIWLDESVVELPQDGLYQITHMVIPTVEWLQNIIEVNPETLKEYENIFVSDGNKIYQYIDQQLQEVTVELIAEINTNKTTISRGRNNTFSIWNLQKCYIQLCNLILQQKPLKCVKHIDNDIIFNRDLAWMTINMIKYYLGFGQIYEAQRILEQVNYCNGICKESKYKPKYQNNCGCS